MDQATAASKKKPGRPGTQIPHKERNARSTRIEARLPFDVYGKLKAISVATGQTLTDVIVSAIEAAYARLQKK